MCPVFCLLFVAFLVPTTDRYQHQQQGVVSDQMYCRIGDGTVIPPSVTRCNIFPLTAGVNWNNDMMCGNFDIDTTARNQLSGVTDGLRQLMGEVIESATSAIANLPAMVIQRVNPRPYDLLTNGMLQGRLNFDKSLLGRQKMAGKMTDYVLDPAWTRDAQAEDYQGITASEKDTVRADQRTAGEAAEKGKCRVGGEHCGGKGQPLIKLIRNTTVAGYDILNNRSTTNTSSMSSNDYQGKLC